MSTQGKEREEISNHLYDSCELPMAKLRGKCFFIKIHPLGNHNTS